MNSWHGFKRLMVVSAASCALAVPGGAQASLEWFLKIDGIKGESTDERHKDEIVIEAFSWGAQRSAVVTGIPFGTAQLLSTPSRSSLRS